MVVKVYISGISGNKEVKKRQQRVLMILDSKNIKYEIIDITEPGKEADKDFMQNNAKCSGGTVSDPNPRSPLPPQIFHDEEYCGDYDKFDLANEVDTLEQFLKLEGTPEEPQDIDVKTSVVNGNIKEDNIEQETIQNNADESGDHKNETTPKEPTSDDVPLKEPSEEKESSADRLQPEEADGSMSEEKSPIEETNIETKESSKESSPVTKDDVHENGVESSREQSNEKEIKSVSEALIENEKAVAAE